MEMLENARRFSNGVPEGGERVVLFEHPGEKRQSVRRGLAGLAPEADPRRGRGQGLGGREGPSSRTMPEITTQPTASSQSPWRIIDFSGMQPVP